MNTRRCAVCGQFYPSNANEILKMINHFNDVIDEHMEDKSILSLKPRAIIVPHAGYVYSGFTANMAFRLLANSEVKRVVVIGPSHRVYINGASIAKYDDYETPFGNIKIDNVLTEELSRRFNLSFTPNAHNEHSTEVQMPFVVHYIKNCSVVEMVYGDESSKELSKVIEYLLNDINTAVVISSDLSHYYDIHKAKMLDSICLEGIIKEDSTILDNGCEACGKIGIQAMLIAAKKIGLSSKLLDYRTSADASSDESAVVGYASAIFLM
ncbi:MAG: AmmeMemoRadiSam system protein B [Sulfurovaceae bacterium]|nr:AmmeMemoRadiSam system protein B [Sulfurovaceae bacterium]MDD5548396.1 AmmeMemoRadiSam system protein B [Sulfurovaceae bacterium]